VNKLFLTNILRNPKIKGKLTSISRGIRQANVSNSDILNLVIPTPPIEAQNSFAAFAEAADKSKFVACEATKIAAKATKIMLNSLSKRLKYGQEGRNDV
jgi:type I restriction enzyme S subunit